MTGGFEKGVPTNKCYVMGLSHDGVNEVAEMNYARIGHIMLYHKSLIFVIGGVGEDGNVISSCEVFSP